MSAVIVACQTISDEVNKVLAETGIKYPVIWIESGLHNYPEMLKKKLQEQVGRIANVENIILAFGSCGNSLLGLASPNARLIVPRVDDCISLLLGSVARRVLLTRKVGTYFLTRGWMVYENNIVREYERCVERYGEERARRVMKSIMGHYRRLMLIGTSAYPLGEYLEKSRAFAALLGLEHEVVSGSLEYLRKLFTGPWDDDFVVLPPGRALTLEDFRLEIAGTESQLSLLTPSR